ncbi:RNA polymerase sigma factor [Defluviitalea phaphyphila]|uniref:RNA polymerase sigma factor n=1 Tax=Defluviitalea phaphyphila TaxID=1473580 RepID=UPI0007DC039D|nr:sigma-70 family RNA polymerase sigma factor [Defluviitalea phaphyphila]
MSNKDEISLIKKAKKGDILAFEELILRYEAKIYNIAYRMLSNEEDAKDVSQEIFIKVFKKLKKFRGDSNFSTWLYRIATNACIDELRKRKGKEIYSVDEKIETKEGSIIKEYVDDKQNVEELIINKEKAYSIQLAINKLSEEHKKAIILRDLQGLEYNEISKILECSLGTVKSKISRARRKLKELLINEELFEYKTSLKRRKEGRK